MGGCQPLKQNTEYLASTFIVLHVQVHTGVHQTERKPGYTLLLPLCTKFFTCDILLNFVILGPYFKVSLLMHSHVQRMAKR